MTSSLVHRLRSQAGFTIVEVAASAVLLIIVVLGVFASLDTASGISGSNKARAIASGLAQEDLERIRALKGPAVANLRETRRPTAWRRERVTRGGSAGCPTGGRW